MNAGDRIALALGKALMRAEALQDERDQLLAKLQEMVVEPEPEEAPEERAPL